MHPRLRPRLEAAPHRGAFVLHDPHRWTPSQVLLSHAELRAADLLTGSHAPDHIAAKVSGVDVPALLAKLADGLFLVDSFLQYLEGPVRRPACVGVYPPDPEGVRRQIRGLFDGPGEPTPRQRDDLRGVLLPHMDYARGGVTYGHGFKALAERTRAKLFVVLATSHYSGHRFTLSKMDFATPLGVVPTDRAYVDRVAAAYGDAAFADPVAHLPEHSIELELIGMQYAFGNDFRIVPLLVGSFGDAVKSGRDPAGFGDVSRMAAALKAAEAAAGEPVCYVVSGDLAHIGPKFDDPHPVSESQLAHGRDQDRKLLDAVEAGDPEAYFRVITSEKDARRICGFPPTWLALTVLGKCRGEVLHYGRYVHPDGHESVSFAAAAFTG